MSSTDGPRPVFVVGFHRSGTTLLHALIGAHPHIAAPPEIGFYARVFARRQLWGDLRDDDGLRQVVETALDRATLVEAGFDAERVLERARTGPRTYAGVLAAIMADFADRQGKPRWCEKTPLQPAEWIWQQFPAAQLVHIVRDPRDAVASHAQLPWDVPDPVTLARTWRAFTAETMRRGSTAGPSAYLRLRYEDLAAQPEPVLRRVFEFLGEEHDEGPLRQPERRQATVMPVATAWLGRVLEPITAPPKDAWRTTLSTSARARVAPVVRPLVTELGYTAAPTREVMLGRVLNGVRAPGDLVRRFARRFTRTGRFAGKAGANEQAGMARTDLTG